MSESLLEAIDQFLQDKAQSRSSFITEAIEAYYKLMLRQEAERELAQLYPDAGQEAASDEWMDADLTEPLA